MGILQKQVFKTFIKMTNKEMIERNIGLTFDFLKQVIKDTAILNKIPDGSIIEFIEKDFTKIETMKSEIPDKYIKVNSQFELIETRQSQKTMNRRLKQKKGKAA
jgi:hypothetical protein